MTIFAFLVFGVVCFLGGYWFGTLPAEESEGEGPGGV